MSSLRQIKRRMKSIENIHEITKAMEMIAAFRFKRAENRFSKSRTYFLEIERLISNLSNASVNFHDPLFEKRQIRRKALVVVTADKGLCGSYNANLLRRALGWLNENKAVEAFLAPVGKIGVDFFSKRRVPMLASFPEKSRADFEMARNMTEQLKAFFLQGKVDSIEILYTTFRVGVQGKIKLAPFLSLDRLLKNSAGEKKVTDYIYEPNFAEVFSPLLSRFMEGEMYGVLLESLTSEYAARMAAMKQATENGEEVLDSLKLLRNKTRQATITRELSEIVSGASVLV